MRLTRSSATFFIISIFVIVRVKRKVSTYLDKKASSMGYLKTCFGIFVTIVKHFHEDFP